MTAGKKPPPPTGTDAPSRDESNRPPPEAPRPATKVTPVDRKVGEGPGNLRDRANAFNRRRGGKS
jgi:hypothetical protein